jgi:hypothetical protein
VSITTVGSEDKIFFAVGRDSTGAEASGGTADYIERSLDIDVSRIRNSSTVEYSAPQNQIQILTWSNTDCESEYCLKFNFNAVRISEDLGFNPLYKTFNNVTDCCDDSCDTCGGGDCAELATDFAAVVNDDKDGLVTATVQVQNTLSFETEDISGLTDAADAIITAGGHTFTFTLGDYTGDDAAAAAQLEDDIEAALDSFNIPYTSVTVVRDGPGDYNLDIVGVQAEEIDFEDGTITTTATATENGCPSIYFELNPYAIADWCNLPRNYTEPIGVTAEIFGDCEWDCNSTINVVQDMAYEIGGGETVKFAELEASGFGMTSDPLYRYNSLLNPNFERTTYASTSTDYVQFVIEHIDNHEGAPSGHFFDSVLYTLVAQDTSLTTLNTNLDTFFASI